jgi:predicted metal-dependent HD superfamily phosphohydrolase
MAPGSILHDSRYLAAEPEFHSNSMSMAGTSTSIIVDSAEEQVTALLLQLSSQYTYHNVAHTRRTVGACRTIGEGSGLSERELEILLLAAWFHDAGLVDLYEGHEERSAELARGFLLERGYPPESIDRVADSILATREDAAPESLLGEILRDADVVHTGKRGYFEQLVLLRAELENICQEVFSDLEWTDRNIALLEQRRFRTPFARAKYTKQWAENLSRLQRQRYKLLERGAIGRSSRPAGGRIQPEEPEKARHKVQGLESMLRISSANQMSLLSRSDGRAGMMIGINSLMIALVLALLPHWRMGQPWVMAPAFTLLAVCLLGIVFATMAVSPGTTGGPLLAEEETQGNHLDLPAVNDPGENQERMVRELYRQGEIIGRKQRHLRICYNVFMYGLGATVAALAIAVVFGR